VWEFLQKNFDFIGGSSGGSDDIFEHFLLVPGPTKTEMQAGEVVDIKLYYQFRDQATWVP